MIGEDQIDVNEWSFSELEETNLKNKKRITFMPNESIMGSKKNQNSTFSLNKSPAEEEMETTTSTPIKSNERGAKRSLDEDLINVAETPAKTQKTRDENTSLMQEIDKYADKTQPTCRVEELKKAMINRIVEEEWQDVKGKKQRTAYRAGSKATSAEKRNAKLFKVKAEEGSVVPTKLSYTKFMSTMNNFNKIEQRDIIEVRFNNKEKWVTLKIAPTTEKTCRTIMNAPMTLDNGQIQWRLEPIDSTRLGVVKAMMDRHTQEVANKDEMLEYLQETNEGIRAARPIGKGFVWLLTFNGGSLPKTIYTPFGERNVVPYVSAAEVCAHCREMGHTKKNCILARFEPVCRHCGSREHDQKECQNRDDLHCPTCKEDGHKPNDPEKCPKAMKAREIKVNKIKSYADAINKNKEKQPKNTDKESVAKHKNSEDEPNTIPNRDEFPALPEPAPKKGEKADKMGQNATNKNTEEAKKFITTNLDERIKQLIKEETQKFKETIMNEVKTFIEKSNEKMMKEMEEVKRAQEVIKKAQGEIIDEQKELKNMIKNISEKQDNQQTEMKDDLKTWFGEAIRALSEEMRKGVSETVAKVLDDQIEERRRSRSKNRASNSTRS